jgi:translation elongation factor EF-G
MPDIKTALTSVLSQWEQDEKKQITQQKEKPMGAKLFRTTNNVTRETFNYIKNNPNKTAAEVCKALEKRGFKEGSVTSICAQLSKQGQVIKDGHTKRMVAIATEYTPLKAASKFKSNNASKTTLKVVKRREAPQDAGLAAIAPKEKVDTSRSTIVLNRNWTAQGVVEKLSVVQARELYDLLKQIFGG